MVRFTTSRVFAIVFLMFLLTAPPMSAQQKAEWTWGDKDGKTHTRAELDTILWRNRWWFDHEGGKLDMPERLAGAHLSGVQLASAELYGEDLSGADLSGADLSGANLQDADLPGAYLTEAHLDGANLFRADLGNASLTAAHLTGARLNANFHHASLLDANLDRADLEGADLSSANLTGATLSGADLKYAHLSGTILIDADLMNARLLGADVGGVIFEPKSLPELREIAAAKNLELLTYDKSPVALFQLRKQFVDGGFREQERKITYALKRREAELSWEGCKSRKTGDKTRAILWSPDSNLANCGSFILNRVFFDWTCQYGMSPGRPLSLGMLVWAFCSILYFVSIRASGEAGLYRVYAQSIHDDPPGQKRVERIAPPAITQTGRVRRLFQFVWREWVVFRASMFFSLMSAFNIGFRDINFGRWLRLLTRQEFDIKAVGWARVVAGWQSLISVYFIALWVLTYFGRPFG